MNSHNLPKRLTDVRELAHLSQTALAERLGVSPSLISHWEGGTRVPSETQLVELAGALGVTLDYLLNAEFIPQFQFRGKATLDAVQQREIEGVLKDASQQVYFVDQVARAAGKNLKPFGLMAEFDFEQLSSLAAQFRDTLRLNRRVTLEELKEALSERHIFVFDWAMPIQVSGLSYRGPTTVIIINQLHTNERKLFTLAHEFAHVLFHLGRKKDMEAVVSVIASFRDPIEKQANKFASEFIMPASEIDRLVKESGEAKLRQPIFLAMAAKILNVSVDALFYRLAERGIFKWEEKSRYVPKWLAEKPVPTMRVEKPGLQVSKEFLQDVISLYESEKASAGKLAEWLFAPRLKVEEFLAELRQEPEYGIGGG